MKEINPYIEDTLNKLTQEETGKRQYYRPVYSIHKWWARRPGALFRSIILLSTLRKLSERLFVPTANGTLSEQSEYFQDHDLGNIIILDPFMGGGTTLVEANRLGAKIVGCDINPVSYWIVRETLKHIELQKLDAYFHQLEQDTGAKIKYLYQTACPHCGITHADGLYNFWMRYIRCPFCNKEIYLFKRTLLNEGLSRSKSPSRTNPAIAFCPKCFVLNEWYGEKTCCCKQCNNVFDPRSGTYDQGYFACPHCKADKISLVQIMKGGQQLFEKLIAIEYWCPRCRNRLYKSPDLDDLKKLEAIRISFEESKEQLLFPKQPILEGASSARWRLHNFRYYHEIFNIRQLFAFNYLIAAISRISEEEYRNAFVTIFSNALEYNNMMTPYNYPNRKLHHLFNYHALPLTTTPVENSVWGVSEEGAGTFVNCYVRYVRAKQYCLHPFDRFKDTDGKVRTVYAKNETISANFVSSFEELREMKRGVLLLCNDSSSMPEVHDKSVDFVITDPPYFDNIHYSELSNFFYVWLRLLLNDQPCFVKDNVPTEQEVIVNEGMSKNRKDYLYLLTTVLKECRRVLKDEGLLIFTFHHTKLEAWWTVLNAIVESGFYVTDSFPVMSEYKINPHIRNKQSMDMDLVLVCEKKSRTIEHSPLTLDKIIKSKVENLLLKASSRSKNRLFLCFMGELLKGVSRVWDSQKVTYEWFTKALADFNAIVCMNVESAKEPSGDSSCFQLQLF
jgi:putative DNA methylase